MPVRADDGRRAPNRHRWGPTLGFPPTMTQGTERVCRDCGLVYEVRVTKPPMHGVVVAYLRAGTLLAHGIEGRTRAPPCEPECVATEEARTLGRAEPLACYRCSRGSRCR